MRMDYIMRQAVEESLADFNFFELSENWGQPGGEPEGYNGTYNLGVWNPSEISNVVGRFFRREFMNDQREAALNVETSFRVTDDPQQQNHEFLIWFNAYSGCSGCASCCALLWIRFVDGQPEIEVAGPVCGPLCEVAPRPVMGGVRSTFEAWAPKAGKRYMLDLAERLGVQLMRQCGSVRYDYSHNPVVVFG